MRVFSVKDLKAETNVAFFWSRNAGTAMREVASKMENPDDPWRRNPEDFVLFELGEFDEFKTELVGAPAVQVIHLMNLVSPSHNPEVVDGSAAS